MMQDTLIDWVSNPWIGFTIALVCAAMATYWFIDHRWGEGIVMALCFTVTLAASISIIKSKKEKERG